MTQNHPLLHRAKAALGVHNDNPLARLMAGFTGFAVAVTLILASSIPVDAGRGVCVAQVEASIASCGQN